MELDRNVSEYMQRKNMLAVKAASMLSAQLLLVAVYFCALNITKTETGFLTLRIVLAVLSSLLVAIGIIVSFRYRNVYDTLPDDIGLRQSLEVIRYAYDIAKPALTFNMTIAGIVTALGILVPLVIMSAMPGSGGVTIAKAVFFLFMAAAVFVLTPSFSRMFTYEQMLSRHIAASSIDTRKSILLKGILLSILIPVSVCIYLQWKYFGSAKNEIAWIVFCLAGIIYAVVTFLAEMLDTSAA